MGFSVDVGFQWLPLPRNTRAMMSGILGGGLGVGWPDSLPHQEPRSREGLVGHHLAGVDLHETPGLFLSCRCLTVPSVSRPG